MWLLALLAATPWSPYEPVPTPTAAALTADFSLQLIRKDYAPALRHTVCRIWSVRDGAVVQRTGGEAYRGVLTAEETRALLEQLTRLEFWALNDNTAPGETVTYYSAHLRRGSVTRDVEVRSDCPMSTKGSSCPQMQLVGILAEACGRASTPDPPPAQARRWQAALDGVRVHLGTIEGVPEGPLRDVIRSALAGSEIALGGCVVRALRRNPNAKGEDGALVLDVDAAGRVSRAELDPRRLELTDWGGCFKERWQRLVLPASGAAWSVRVPVSVELDSLREVRPK